MLSIRPTPYIIPSYSLTGDLLAYLKCGLQYRYHNKGSLPPSIPVQLWFGEFIHGIMEESFLNWSQSNRSQTFPWNWQSQIRPIELEINRRLESRGIYPPPNLFDRDENTNEQRLASRRAEAAINTWGPHLFPLIDRAEVRLQGLRPMPGTAPNPRANYYETTGVIDVLGSVQLSNAPRGNLILHYLQSHEEVQNAIANAGSRYEIIVDYKGMRRPNTNSPQWQHYSWQVLTYAWLRFQQPSSAPVVAGILLFLNELVPAQQDIVQLRQAVSNRITDVLPQGHDARILNQWRSGQRLPPLSTTFLEQRSFLILPIDPTRIQSSLSNFDNTVCNIETAVAQETNGQSIPIVWTPRPDRDTCTACDFKTFCPQSAVAGAPFAP